MFLSSRNIKSTYSDASAGSSSGNNSREIITIEDDNDAQKQKQQPPNSNASSSGNKRKKRKREENNNNNDNNAQKSKRKKKKKKDITSSTNNGKQQASKKDSKKKASSSSNNNNSNNASSKYSSSRVPLSNINKLRRKLSLFDPSSANDSLSKQLDTLVEARLRRDVICREKDLNYSKKQLKRFKELFEELHGSAMRCKLTEMQTIYQRGWQNISSVAIFGHLDIFFHGQTPQNDQIMRYSQSLFKIEHHFTSSRMIPRTKHFYYTHLSRLAKNASMASVSNYIVNMGMRIRDCPSNGQKETYTKTMLTDISLHAAQNPDSLLILVLRELKNFSFMMHRIKELKVPMILIVVGRDLDQADYDILRSVEAPFFIVEDLLQSNGGKTFFSANELIGYDPQRREEADSLQQQSDTTSTTSYKRIASGQSTARIIGKADNTK